MGAVPWSVGVSSIARRRHAGPGGNRMVFGVAWPHSRYLKRKLFPTYAILQTPFRPRGPLTVHVAFPSKLVVRQCVSGPGALLAGNFALKFAIRPACSLARRRIGSDQRRSQNRYVAGRGSHGTALLNCSKPHQIPSLFRVPCSPRQIDASCDYWRAAEIVRALCLPIARDLDDSFPDLKTVKA